MNTDVLRQQQPMPKMIEAISWDEVKTFFHAASEQLAKEYL